MKSNINFRMVGLWILTVITFALLSPKWLFAPAAWIAPACLMAFFGRTRFWNGLLWGWLALVVSGLLSNYGVMPFPGIFFAGMTLFLSLIKVIPFLVSNVLGQRCGFGWACTLIFPSVMVVSEYVNSFGGGGTWGSLAYTQFENYHLIQLASLGGIWPITFLLTWFASLLNWLLVQNFKWSAVRKPVIIYAVIFFSTLLYGTLRTNSYFSKEQGVVRIAGITANNAVLVKAMYEDYYDQKMNIDPDQLTQASPELQELQKGFVKFIENPHDIHFTSVHHVLVSFQDSLLSLADREAKSGAKLITFSEGLFITPKDDEGKLINQAKTIAVTNKVYVALPLASLLPGKVEMGSKYMENKVMLINPSGEIENIFFKNKPVPVVEGSIPGDGEIPVVKTPFGNIAISICYDADFPSLMRKAGKKESDILILPSGDWKEVSPFHAHMATFRAIENGFSLFRMVSGATSMAADQQGRIISSIDFYTSGERVMIAYLPTERKRTLYSVIGDSFAWACALFLILNIAYVMKGAFRKK